MKKKLTTYLIQYGSNEKVFIAIADKSIPFKVIECYSDVEESFIFEGFIKSTQLPIIRKVCKDTGKSAILLRNQKSKILRDFINEILGNEVTLVKYSFKQWEDFIRGIEEYSSENLLIVEIDHPINLKDEMLILIIKSGLEYAEKRCKEIQEKLNKIKKASKKGKKKNGK